ncbi:MAG: acyl-CoA dehydrogenase family protein [Thermoplasmata archaeon]|nr:acyl-CoA dehydrogenase family protein [Thermoplasmata archaeon]
MTIPPPGVPEHPIVREIDRVSERLGLSERAAELDRNPSFPRQEFEALGTARLLGLITERRWGGRALTLPVAGSALYRLAYLSGTTFAKLSLQPEFSSVLAGHGRPEIARRHFPPLVKGRHLIGNHITEPGAGSDAAALSTRATRRGKEYVLNGTKSQAAFADDADAAIVYAKVEGPATEPPGVSAFLVPQELPGIRRTITGDMGERWMRRGTVEYREVRVPASHLIGEEGKAFGYLKGELTRERALLAPIYLGVARASWEDTVRYVGEREAFGGPLSRQQAVSFPLVEGWARLEAATGYAFRTLERMALGESVDAEAALSKWLATETSLGVIDLAIQFHGGRGYSNELPHERRWRDVRSGAIAHGPSEIMHLIATRTLWPRKESPAGRPRPAR